MLEALQQRITLAARAAAAAGDIADAQFLEGLLEDRGLGNTEKSIEFEEAAGIFAREGQVKEAAELFLKGRVPAKAAALICKSLPPAETSPGQPLGIQNAQGKVDDLRGFVPVGMFSPKLIESTVEELKRIDLHEVAADLLAHLGHWRKALSLHQKCRNFPKAVAIAEAVARDALPSLYKSWAEANLEEGKVEEAVAHFIKAGCKDNAVEACLSGGLWQKARQLLKGQRDEASVQKLLAVARKLEDQGDMSEAEQAYLEVNAVERAVRMRLERGQLAIALKIVRNAPSREKLRPFMQQLAQQLAAGKKFEDAEAVLLAIGDVQGALQLLQTHSQFDRLILLIDTQCPAERDAICMRLASRLADIGSYSDAERFFLACGAWQQAADMYADVEDWAAACRVAASEGGAAASRRMCLRHAQKLLRLRGPKAAVQMLVERGECGAAVELAVENREFPLAIETARKHCLEKTKEVYMQLGRHKEASGDTSEAENAYLKAQAPEAAIALYKKRGKWTEAVRLSRQFRPAALQQLLMEQAKTCVLSEDLEGAQAALLEAGRADLVVQLLLRKEQWAAAVRLCGEKAKEMLPWVLQQYNNKKPQFESIQELREFCKVRHSDQSHGCLPQNCREKPVFCRSTGNLIPLPRIFIQKKLKGSKRVSKSVNQALEGVGATENAIDVCLSTGEVLTADLQELRPFWMTAVLPHPFNMLKFKCRIVSFIPGTSPHVSLVAPEGSQGVRQEDQRQRVVLFASANAVGDACPGTRTLAACGCSICSSAEATACRRSCLCRGALHGS
ncbi:intraflagellar transport protein 172 homolog [Cyclospora cayetanensis]|uniref:Intraflagellar transport protein 172 homolog n=1 Tax=Cyclospora cayetanensis TaxID=88456 RepID=A0A6P6S315_9EIME|nr:intraflagellar transport protein 172 homolog [Cyclospora cayetanensis]